MHRYHVFSLSKAEASKTSNPAADRSVLYHQRTDSGAMEAVRYRDDTSVRLFRADESGACCKYDTDRISAALLLDEKDKFRETAYLRSVYARQVNGSFR